MSYNKNMKIMVTGGAGFIGSNLVNRCLKENIDVSVVDDLSNGHKKFLPSHVLDRLMVSDFASDEVLAEIKRGVYDAVIHLAAVPRVGYSVEHPLETNDTNVSKTLRLIESCKGNVHKFVFASSSSVYGDSNSLPTNENDDKRPNSPYALQKSIIEDYLNLYHKLYGLDSACLRFFNVFGPNQLGDSPYSTAISAWLTAIKSGKPMRSDGDGTQTRDMCYVDNVVDACLKAARHVKPLNAECFNVACGEGVSNKQIMEYLLKKYPGSTYVNAPWRPGDVMHTLADVIKSGWMLDYRPLFTFWEGLDRTIEWYDTNWDMISKMRLRTLCNKKL